jgi:hypothetical protein
MNVRNIKHRGLRRLVIVLTVPFCWPAGLIWLISEGLRDLMLEAITQSIWFWRAIMEAWRE